jgi:riboflavin kinase/FMN adenylyltransferase
VCIGVFDGVHVGHQEVLRSAVADARSASRPAVLVTFDRHPARVLRPGAAPPMVATLGQNLRAFERCGIDVALVLAFDAALAATPAQAFFDAVLRGLLRAESVVVGHDFAFGHSREGTPDWLEARIATTVVPPLLQGGVRVSSTQIRTAVASGDVEAAARMLGHPYALVGCVVQGLRLGRTLGYPTANVEPIARQVLPGEGVYAGRANTPSGSYLTAVSVGARPTVAGAGHATEAYLLDYPGQSLYGRIVELELWERIRGQARFDDLDALRKQMAEDVRGVRARMARHQTGPESVPPA